MWQGWQNIWQPMYGKMRVSKLSELMVWSIDFEKSKYSIQDLYLKISKQRLAIAFIHSNYTVKIYNEKDDVPK